MMGAMKSQADPLVVKAYADADHEQRIRLSRIGCILVLIHVPIFFGLDYITYPTLLYEFGLARLLCCVGVIAIWALLLTTIGRNWIRLLGIAWALLPAIAISWMIYFVEGEKSPYYIGLILVMIVVTLLMPWTALEVSLVCALTMAMYLMACFMHPNNAPLDWWSLISNLYFLVSTATICITAGFYASQRRFEEFRLRYELDQRNHQLAEMDQLKSQFFGNVSHELRTPLTLILAPIDNLLDKVGLGRENQELLGMMRRNALRLLRLINDILDIVRMDGSHLVLNRSRLELNSWIPGIVSSLSYLSEAKRLTLSLQPPANPVMINADILMLEKVLMNLLTNAVKFTPENGQITISWGQQTQHSWIAVSDTGIGIADEELPKLFTRFHQIDGTSTRRYRGLGLGLSLSRDLVERHGGQLRATSTLGQGSTFTIELPTILNATAIDASSVAAGDETKPTDSTNESVENEHDAIVHSYHQADRFGHTFETADDRLALGKILEPERVTSLSDLVLVAEDEPDMRRFIVGFLRERYRVVAFADGAAAVAGVRQFQPSLVILDMMMPSLNGVEACRAIRRDNQANDCRIMLLTARGDDETKLSALQSGADDFLTKPFSSEEVLSRAHNLLENAALQRSLRMRNQELEETIARLRQTEAYLVQSEKMNGLGSLAAGLLHEINNPLNYSQTAIYLARENVSAGDETLGEMLKDAHEGMTRISDVISSLRTFAYPETTNLNQPFAFDEALQLALRFTSFKCKGVDVKCQVSPDLQVCGSVNQISMLLVNLISNADRAVRANRNVQGKIHVRAEERETSARIEVSDSGIGMEESLVKRAFDPFYTTCEPGQGMGLGLAICHTIIRNHRGTIGITSQLGVGTTVWFELPIPAAVAALEPVHE